MKVKSSHAHIVNTKQLGRETLRDIYNQYIRKEEKDSMPKLQIVIFTEQLGKGGVLLIVIYLRPLSPYFKEDSLGVEPVIVQCPVFGFYKMFCMFVYVWLFCKTVKSWN